MLYEYVELIGAALCALSYRLLGSSAAWRHGRLGSSPACLESRSLARQRPDDYEEWT
jgi:hypothetical protein